MIKPIYSHNFLKLSTQMNDTDTNLYTIKIISIYIWKSNLNEDSNASSISDQFEDDKLECRNSLMIFPLELIVRFILNTSKRFIVKINSI